MATEVERSDGPDDGRGWADLPAIQRASGRMELTAHSLDFSRTLAGSLPPRLSLEPLVHERSLEPPYGLADLAVRTVESYAGGEELSLRLRAQPALPYSHWLTALRAALWKRTTGETNTAGTPPEAELPPRQHAALQGVGTDGTPASGWDPRLTMPAPASPRPVLAHALAVRARGTSTARDTPLTVAPDVRPAAEPVQAAPAAMETAPLVASPSEKSATPRPSSLSPDSGPRLEPYGRPPAGPLASPIVRVQRRKSSPEPPGEASTQSILEELPVQPRAWVVGGPSSEATAGLPLTEVAALLTEPSKPASAPTLPPMPPMLAAPRPSGISATGLSAPVGVQRSRRIEGTGRAPIPVLRAAVSSAEPSLSAVAGSLPLVPATNGDQFQPTRGAEPAASPLPLPLRPLPSASLAIQALPLHGSAPAAVPSPAVQTAAFTSIIEVSPPAPVEVQRAAEELATVPAPAASLSEAGLVGAAGGYPDRELDELSGRIYDRIRTRLRTELLIDRERAGLVTDLR